MRRFFKSGQRLKSPALTEFRDVLASLPKLKTINLTGKACVTRDGCPCCEYLHWEDDQFFRFAFTGERQEKLCTEMALYLMKRFVYCPPMSLLVNDQKSKKRVAQAKRNGKAIFTIEWPLLRMDQTQDLEMMDYKAWLETPHGRAKYEDDYLAIIRGKRAEEEKDAEEDEVM